MLLLSIAYIALYIYYMYSKLFRTRKNKIILMLNIKVAQTYDKHCNNRFFNTCIDNLTHVQIYGSLFIL